MESDVEQTKNLSVKSQSVRFTNENVEQIEALVEVITDEQLASEENQEQDKKKW